MKLRFAFLVALAAMLALPLAASAQQNTGTIVGRAADGSGAVLPGATVTVSGPALLQPRVMVTSETGTYRAPDLPIGTYQVRFEMPGFSTVVMEGIRVSIGFNAEINATLEVSAVQETVTVSGESPVVDTKTTAAKSTFDLEALQNIPSARDPWVMLERTPAIAMDRVNVGGTQSGQQSGYVSRGSGSTNNKWSIDGVDITDMSATGASPMYYDFDMLEEMQVTTGGADASQQTGGVGINFVMRSGTDRFRGSGRYYVTDDSLQGDNITDEVKLQRSGSGAPIQNIKDYGFEVGGPIMRGRLWYWGSYGKQDIKAGIVGFYLPTPECQQMKRDLAANPLAPYSTDEQRACLGTDGTLLDNYNWRLSWVPFTNNKFSFQNTWAMKSKNARNASDTRPIETTWVQGAVPSKYGTAGWDVGANPLWKASDQHVISDRWLVDFQYSHLGNNFILDFHEPDLNDVQPVYDIPTGVWGRSYNRSGPYIRPTTSYDLTTNYFLPNVIGGDHAFKAGFRYRTAPAHSETHWGGNTVAAFRSGVASEAWLFRDSVTDYDLKTWAVYLQDTFTINRFTLNLGFRVDHQDDEALSSTVPAHPFAPQWLPSVTFAGADSGVTWTDWSPRLGVNYDLSGDGHTVLRSSYAIYYGQMAPGTLAGILNPVTEAEIDFRWNDANGDKTVQANEVDYASGWLFYSGNYNPNNPGFVGTANTVDPNVKNERTREFIAGIDHEMFRGFAVGATYIWRKYDRWRWDDRVGFGSADYVSRTFTPAATACPNAGARCPAVTYYEPTRSIPSLRVRTNQPDYYRDYNGFELSATKRYSSRWGANVSFAYNDAVENYASANAYEDPTNIDKLNGGQFAPESGGSGIDNVFTNAKWLFKASGLYTAWWDIGIAANFQYRQGFPFPQAVQSPTRANGAGRANVLLDTMGDVRFDDLYVLDLKVDKAFRFGTFRIIPSLDIFNATNANTVLARRRIQNAANGNYISGIVAPLVMRFGVRVNW
jgi:hypothetical protein